MLKYKQTMSELECLSITKNNILGNIKKQSSGVQYLKNNQQVKNRIVENALSVFVNRNYYFESVIQCEDGATHYNKPIGSIIKRPCGVGELPINKHAEHLKALHKLANKLSGV